MYDSFGTSLELIDAIVPRNGVMALIYQAFFDESGTHDGSPIMTVGSYVFLKSSASKFTRQWGQKLKHHGLTHAHMTDCATGNGEYKNMSLEKRIQIEKDLIDLIKSHSLFGTGISIDVEHFNRAMTGKQHVYGPYTLLLLLTVEKISAELRNRSPNSSVSYFFESGHKSAGEANLFMNSIRRFSGQAGDNYLSHTFADKRAFLPLHAADMIAWQTRHSVMRKREGFDTLRKDFVALKREQDLFSTVPSSRIDWFAGMVEMVDPLATKGPFELLERIQKYVSSAGFPK